MTQEKKPRSPNKTFAQSMRDKRDALHKRVGNLYLKSEAAADAAKDAEEAWEAAKAELASADAFLATVKAP
jgi:hypothetical protein